MSRVSGFNVLVIVLILLRFWPVTYATPTGSPTSIPSGEPTSAPAIPSGEPTSIPSGQPTSIPSGEPTSIPSGEPTSIPSGQPTQEPSLEHVYQRKKDWKILIKARNSQTNLKNKAELWYQEGVGGDESGKKDAYDHMKISELRFSHSKDAWIQFKLRDHFKDRTLLDIVTECVNQTRRDEGNKKGQWDEALCVIGDLIDSGGIDSGNPSPYLRVGLGDGTNDAQDWALFMVLSGGSGNFDLSGIWNFGGEYVFSNKKDKHMYSMIEGRRRSGDDLVYDNVDDDDEGTKKIDKDAKAAKRFESFFTAGIVGGFSIVGAIILGICAFLAYHWYRRHLKNRVTPEVFTSKLEADIYGGTTQPQSVKEYRGFAHYDENSDSDSDEDEIREAESGKVKSQAPVSNDDESDNWLAANDLPQEW